MTSIAMTKIGTKDFEGEFEEEWQIIRIENDGKDMAAP